MLSGMLNFKPSGPSPEAILQHAGADRTASLRSDGEKVHHGGEDPGRDPCCICRRTWQSVAIATAGRRVAGGETPAEFIAMLGELDEFDSYDNGIENAITSVLLSKTAKTETKIALLKAMPMKYVGTKQVHFLNLAVAEIAKGNAPALKATADKVLEEAKKKGLSPQ